jgi:hypothetical protein
MALWIHQDDVAGPSFERTPMAKPSLERDHDKVNGMPFFHSRVDRRRPDRPSHMVTAPSSSTATRKPSGDQAKQEFRRAGAACNSTPHSPESGSRICALPVADLVSGPSVGRESAAASFAPSGRHASHSTAL